jgi:DNA-binding beta-propeller fold protein YncE
MKIAVLSLSIALVVSLGSAGEAQFSTKPSAAKDGDKVKVSFALSAPTDVEVAVLDSAGKVVRHLAAGALGAPKPPPEPLKTGLAQNLEWDGKDDYGKPVTGATKVRVRAGTEVKLGGFVGDPDVLESGIYGLATDDQGELYVATGGAYGGNLFTVKVFDRDGKYLRTIFPYPASLKVEDVNGFAKHTPRDGKLNPPQFNGLLPWIYPNALGALMGNRVQAGALWLTSGSGQICRIRAADGGCISWNAGQAPAPPALGPICWGASPDGKTLYLAGWKGGKEPDGQIYKVDPATGARSVFAKIDVPANSFWLTEKNGWFNFTNWGRKNGVCAIHGLAVDKDGQVYACDRVNNRLAVFGSDGQLLGSTPVEQPDHVALSPKGPEIYVTTRKIVDGYQAKNEVKVIKLSGWKDGKVLAELTLKGSNAPSMAVDATKDPAVIWLSNVGDKGGVTRIEDKGASFAVTGRLGEKTRPMPGAVVKAWADPMSDTVILSDGWAGQAAYNGLTGDPVPWPLKGMELAFDRDGNYYIYGQAGWHELITRFDRSFKPLAYPATNKNTTTMSTRNLDVYGRYGHGWCNKGLWIAPDGRIFVYNMYDWAAYFINVWDATGKAEKGERVGEGLIGPLDSQGGTVCVDFQGNIYVGMHGFPKAAAGGRADGAGTVVKFPPTGGGYVKAKGEKPGIEWKGGLMGFVEGGTTAYTGLAPQVGGGCVCKEARFEIDGWGRIYIPNALEYCVKIVDNAGNEIARFGYYGNSDSRGAKSAVPDPEIALGWPIMVSTGQLAKGRLYVADALNHRAVRLEVACRAEETCEVK